MGQAVSCCVPCLQAGRPPPPFRRLDEQETHERIAHYRTFVTTNPDYVSNVLESNSSKLDREGRLV